MTISQQSETESMLQHWREAVPNDRLAHLVRDAARALVRSLSTRLAEHHVSFGHWSFLRVLWVEDGLTQRALSERAGVMEPTTFSAIKTMEQLGYVVRRQHEGDRKKVYIHLTPKGRLLEKRLVPLAEEVNRISVEGVVPEHVAITRTVLLTMIENLARDQIILEKPMPSTRVIAKIARSRARK
jgi:DNA-binding MarR family transcriptional regulator